MRYRLFLSPEAGEGTAPTGSGPIPPMDTHRQDDRLGRRSVQPVLSIMVFMQRMWL